ncbi:hypothetical protein BVI434_3120003 [Burkholderia vietnamiensis]|nr:hypothetical protein BVI434_3120003 [Burkholderia vietnamiensis]
MRSRWRPAARRSRRQRRAARRATARVRTARRTLRGHSIEAMRKDGDGAYRAGRTVPCGCRGTGSRGHIGAPGQGAAEFRETPHALRDHWLRDSEARCGAARPGVRQRTTTTKHRYR